MFIPKMRQREILNLCQQVERRLPKAGQMLTCQTPGDRQRTEVGRRLPKIVGNLPVTGDGNLQPRGRADLHAPDRSAVSIAHLKGPRHGGKTGRRRAGIPPWQAATQLQRPPQPPRRSRGWRRGAPGKHSPRSAVAPTGSSSTASGSRAGSIRNDLFTKRYDLPDHRRDRPPAAGAWPNGALAHDHRRWTRRGRGAWSENKSLGHDRSARPE